MKGTTICFVWGGVHGSKRFSRFSHELTLSVTKKQTFFLHNIRQWKSIKRNLFLNKSETNYLFSPPPKKIVYPHINQMVALKQRQPTLFRKTMSSSEPATFEIRRVQQSEQKQTIQ